jgi:hemolysin activation/secretion protein
MKLNLPFKIARIVGLIFLAESALAIDPPPLGGFLPGSVLPEQVSKSIQSQQPTTPSQVLPALAPPKQAPSPLGAEAQKIKFQLNAIILEDNHVYSEGELRPLYQSKLHKVITVAELFEIVQSITNTYRNNGYILSRAILPPQHVKNGVVRIKVIEGYIGNVTVSGNPRGAVDIVQAYGNKIKACPPLKLNRMEKYLLLANELPGTEVKAVLAPSKTQIGAADLTLVTQNKRFSGYASYDDYGTRYIGPQQMTANVGVNSWIAPGDATLLTMTKTPKGGELTYIDLNHNMPITAEGTTWLLGGTRTQTHPLFVLTPVQIDGVTNNYYTTFNFPMVRSRTKSLNLRAGFNYLDSIVTTFNTSLYTDHIRSLDLGGTYNFTDSWFGSNLLNGDFRQGLPILGYTSNQNPQTAQTSRPGGRGDYTKIALTASRLQILKGPLSLYGMVQGQWAANPLLASEQFTFGGSQLGRGYDVAELIGDEGTAASLELRYDLNIGRMLQNVQLYTFYDAGIIWNFKFIGGTPRKLSGTTTGVGARFYFTKYVSGNFMWTQTLTKQVAAEELIGDGRRPRVFFSIIATLA